MSEEDERTLWCGNLSEKVSEELLYELFVQAGPVEMVKIPRDNDKRQRSYAFITYGHAPSVEYAINIFEGTKLFQRQLTLHKKGRNGPNPAASPKVNFNSGHRGGMQQQHLQGPAGGMLADGIPADLFGQLNLANMPPAVVSQMMANMQQLLMGQEPGGGGSSGSHQQKHQHQGKMNRNDRSHRNDHHQKPYSRDRGGNNSNDGQQLYSRDRNEGPLFSRDRGGGGGGGGNRSGGRNSGGGGGNNQRRNDYRNRR